MPLHHLRAYVKRSRQKRKALLMLALSGVVRPSHVELRYAIPLLKGEDQSKASSEKPVPSVRPSSFLLKFIELMTWPPKEERSLRQHLPTQNRLRPHKSVSINAHSSPAPSPQDLF
jgi:hypothetical protein